MRATPQRARYLQRLRARPWPHRRSLLVDVDTRADEHRFSARQFGALDITHFLCRVFLARPGPHVVNPSRAFDFRRLYELPHESLSVRVFNVDIAFGLQLRIGLPVYVYRVFAGGFRPAVCRKGPQGVSVK